MKPAHTIALVLVGLAVVLNGFGGFLDMFGSGGNRSSGCPCVEGRCPCKKGGDCPCATTGPVLSQRHAWHDSIFLMLFAIFLILAF